MRVINGLLHLRCVMLSSIFFRNLCVDTDEKCKIQDGVMSQLVLVVTLRASHRIAMVVGGSRVRQTRFCIGQKYD